MSFRLTRVARLPLTRVVRAPNARAFSSYNAAVAGLTPEQEEFRETVANFAQKEIAPRAAEIDRTNKLPEVSGGCIETPL